MSDPAVLIVEDDRHLREALFDTLSAESLNVLTADSGPAALEILNKEQVGLVVSDLHMIPMDGATLLRNIHERHPSLPTIVMTAHGTIQNAVDIMRDGAADYLVKPFEASQLKEVVSKYLAPLQDVKRPVAVDAKSVNILRVAERVASTEATVTITGESGVGKEVIARFIHKASPRRENPFVAINCAAIPENMLEAVLFGYEKGAFTGATSAHPGKFEQAHDGTLLLDEISEMDLGLQAKLLRVIQELEVERIGGRKLVPLNVRVLATTNRDLKACVSAGTFREDLYYRLNVFPLHIPPLRERRDDIMPLAELFMQKRSRTPGQELSSTAREKLLVHRWPGNVRELDNLIQRSLILSGVMSVTAEDLAFEDPTSGCCEEDPPLATNTSESGLHEGLQGHEFQLILDALEAGNGNRGSAARALDISPRTLRYKLARMRKHGIAIPGDDHE